MLVTITDKEGTRSVSNQTFQAEAVSALIYMYMLQTQSSLKCFFFFTQRRTAVLLGL